MAKMAFNRKSYFLTGGGRGAKNATDSL